MLSSSLTTSRPAPEATGATDAPWLTFKLDPEYVASFASRSVNWGFPIGAGNSLGELAFLSRYSRSLPDGSKERWHQCCQRVIEGMYSILQQHCLANRTPWKHDKAMRSAKEAYRRMFEMKWLPPGRGLWAMGTEMVHGGKLGSTPLQNCAFLSTSSPDDPSEPFVLLMELSMLGVGVGFDVRGAGTEVYSPGGDPWLYEIPDSREGWVDSLRLLLDSYLGLDREPVRFDYGLIRPAGAPIRGFGGIAAGSDPLRRMHEQVRTILDGVAGGAMTSRIIVDLCNLIGKCVVSGNVRRSAEIAIGAADDDDFMGLKDWTRPENAERMGPDGWGQGSNNSIDTSDGFDIDQVVRGLVVNGEPGLLNLEMCRSFGRLGDPPDDGDRLAIGVNPCGEQALEHRELCTLIEVFPTRCADQDDFQRTLKFAFLYGKTVTLLPTHLPVVNEVMQRNRRIGCSVTGLVEFVETHGYGTLSTWLDTGYREIKRRDIQYSGWLGVRDSVRLTSVKPSGTVSILAGTTPGVHWPVARNSYLRRMRFRVTEPLVKVLAAAGYHVEPDVTDPRNTVVATLPTIGPRVRGEREVSVWEKMELAALLQRCWSDNQVSATFTFSPEEEPQLRHAIDAFGQRLKVMSFLNMGDEPAYEQMPYEAVASDVIETMQASVAPLDWDALYSSGEDAEAEAGCTNDTCEIPR